MLLASQEGCLFSHLVAAAQARGIALPRVNMTVREMPAGHPSRFTRVMVAVEMEGEAGMEELDNPLTMAERGYIVSNTLRGSTTLTAPCRSGVAVPVT
ncbi:MAG: OsmC family protein [Chloroflexota bacterium]|nr:OsmC family protein [Chloroflexota bacterium]